jgi:hypothetical protein
MRIADPVCVVRHHPIYQRRNAALALDARGRGTKPDAERETARTRPVAHGGTTPTIGGAHE